MLPMRCFTANRGSKIHGSNFWAFPSSILIVYVYSRVGMGSAAPASKKWDPPRKRMGSNGIRHFLQGTELDPLILAILDHQEENFPPGDGAFSTFDGPDRFRFAEVP